MKSRRTIILIISWSLLVHLPGLFSPLRDYHAYRQSQTASMARNYVRHGMSFLNPEIDMYGPPRRSGTEFPIYSYILAILFKLFGLKDIFGRLLSMVLAAWGAVYLFLFARRRWDDRIAFWSALVICSLPIHIYFTRTVQPEPMALWGFLGFLYYSDRWLSDSHSWRDWILVIAFASLAPLLKLPFLYLIGPVWLYLGVERYGWRGLFKISWLSCILLVLLTTQAWYHYAKSAPVVILPLSMKEHWDNLVPIFTRRLWENQFISRIPELVTTYSGIFFIIVAIRTRATIKSFGLLLFWTATSVLYVALLGEYGLIHRYTLLPLAPLSAIWIAIGISACLEGCKTNARARWLAALLIIGMPLHAALRIKHWYRLDYGYLPRAHDTLARVSGPNDLILVMTHEVPQHLYYLDRYGYALDPAQSKTGDVLLKFKQGVRFVFVPKEDNEKRLPEWKDFLGAHGLLVEDDPDYLLYKIS